MAPPTVRSAEVCTCPLTCTEPVTWLAALLSVRISPAASREKACSEAAVSEPSTVRLPAASTAPVTATAPSAVRLAPVATFRAPTVAEPTALSFSTSVSPASSLPAMVALLSSALVAPLTEAAEALVISRAPLMVMLPFTSAWFSKVTSLAPVMLPMLPPSAITSASIPVMASSPVIEALVNVAPVAPLTWPVIADPLHRFNAPFMSTLPSTTKAPCAFTAAASRLP